MTISISSRRAVLLAALALLTFVPPTVAGNPQKIRISGTWAATLVHNQLQGTRTGVASPGGPVNGVFVGKQIKGTATGIGMLDFGNGDTLTYEFEASFVSSNLLVGTWVVTGGTGKYIGAAGSGTSFATTPGDGTGDFEYTGSISF